MKSFFFLLFLSLSSLARADEAQLRNRIDELERQVKTLTDKVAKMESTLMKGGGFMITSNVTCNIDTPFDGSYTSTELSEKAARASVLEKCKEHVKDNGQCTPTNITCKK